MRKMDGNSLTNVSAFDFSDVTKSRASVPDFTLNELKQNCIARVSFCQHKEGSLSFRCAFRGEIASLKKASSRAHQRSTARCDDCTDTPADFGEFAPRCWLGTDFAFVPVHSPTDSLTCSAGALVPSGLRTALGNYLSDL